jgi:hypothetical protein
MVVLDRRSLVKALVLLPAAASIGCRPEPREAEERKIPVNRSCPVIPPQMNFVSVVFHGTWIFLVYSDHIQALAPRIGGSSNEPQHISGMGGKNVIVKDALKSGRYELTGFVHNNLFVPPDDWGSVVIDAKQAKIRDIVHTPGNLYYSIKLPFPDAMTPAGHMRIRRVAGMGDAFTTKNNKYLQQVFNRPQQLFSSVQIFTYRPKVSVGEAVSLEIQRPAGKCYQDACYHGNPPVKPTFEQPGFDPVATANWPSPGGRVPFTRYVEPDGKNYAQYHVAYVVHRSEESGTHEDHAFDQLTATLKIDVKSDFCNYQLDELPMSVPVGFSHKQVNLDAFPHESNGRLDKVPVGWYSDEALQELLDAEAETLKQQNLSKEARLVLPKDFSVKPIGNCRSGNVVVLNSPAMSS